VVSLVVGLVAVVGDSAAQDLPLKREMSPVTTPGVCPTLGARPGAPDGAEADEAARLTDEASRAAILGDQTEARELLEEAARLHPGSGSISFQLARTLTGLEEESEALYWLCRSLAWEPDGVDAEAARSLMAELLPASSAPVSRAALDAFREGISAYDDDRFEEAVREFSRALVENPDWASAHYNRGVSSLRAGRTGAALSDLEDYLALAPPQAQDRARVEARVEELALAGPQYSASTAFLSGLVVPGMGQFYTGRPGLGSLILAGAGGAAAAGFFYREVEVECRAVPVNGECPPGEVAGEEERRPYLAAGLGGAAALTVLGAVHAWRSARGASNPEIAGATLRLDGRGLALRLSAPDAGPNPRDGSSRRMTPELRLDPGSTSQGSVLRSFLSVRF
jgi:tetratricopeptide (TPR) repeat protein